MSMTIEEAIKLCEESERINTEHAKNCVSALERNHNLDNAEKCRQMIAWLRELQERMKADSCEGCVKEFGKGYLPVCTSCKRNYADLYEPEKEIE